MRFLLVSLGTHGDVLPHIALGAELQRRGHDVAMAANARFRPFTEGCGLAFHPLTEPGEFDALLSHPDMWHPLRSARVLCDWGMPRLEKHYADIKALVDARPGTVMIANPGVLACRLLQEKGGFPMVSVVLQPALLPSVDWPPVPPFGPKPAVWWPKPLRQFYWAVYDRLTDRILSPHLNPIRESLGLPSQRRFLRWWWLSPTLTLGMYPDWYGRQAADWPPSVHLTGFPIFDGGNGDAPLAEPLSDFLSEGSPPVVFAPGTGNHRARAFFAAGAAACAALGQRALFLTPHRELLPDPLPADTHHETFAPLAKLLPQCAALVHHGGIGTTARALHAGVPQLVQPMAYDQPDNAARVRRLGCGLALPPKKFSPSRVAGALRRLLAPERTARLQEVAAHLHHANPLGESCDLIEAAFADGA